MRPTLMYILEIIPDTQKDNVDATLAMFSYFVEMFS
jgi:hypothetical protein